MSTRVMKLAKIRPPITARAIGAWRLAPLPTSRASGIKPRAVVIVVIRVGRRPGGAGGYYCFLQRESPLEQEAEVAHQDNGVIHLAPPRIIRPI